MNPFEFLSTNNVPADSLLRSLADLGGNEDAKRSAAEQLFETAGPGAAPILMTKLNDTRQRRSDRSMKGGLLFALSLITRSVLSLTGFSDWFGASLVDVASIGLMVVGLGAFVYFLRTSAAENCYYKILEKYDQVQVLGVLAEYGYGSISDRSYFESTIIRLIELIDNEKANVLTNAQRLSLFRLLELVEFPKDDVSPALFQYIRTLLGAYERMGDRRAIPYIRLFVDQGPESAKGRELKQKANDVISSLETLPLSEV